MSIVQKISINKFSKYRLYSRTKGVIGPPQRDSDKIINLNFYADRLSVEWDASGIQEIDYFDIDFQEFVAHEVAWEAIIEHHWHNLLTRTDLVRSNNPKFILFTGLPGSGKSTIAKDLSLRTGWLHFDFANFTNQIIGYSPLVMSDYKKVGELAEKKINDAIKDDISVIYDTTSPSVEIRQHHLDAVEFTNAKYIVYVPTEPKTCLKRVSSREPASSIDIRDGIHRSDINNIRTFWDYVNDYNVPANCILANNEFDSSGVLKKLGQ